MKNHPKSFDQISFFFRSFAADKNVSTFHRKHIDTTLSLCVWGLIGCQNMLLFLLLLMLDTHCTNEWVRNEMKNQSHSHGMNWIEEFFCWTHKFKIKYKSLLSFSSYQPTSLEDIGDKSKKNAVKQFYKIKHNRVVVKKFK